MVFGIFPKSWNYNHGLIHEHFITILKKQKQNKFMLLAVAPIHLTPNSWQSLIYFLFWVSSILNHTTGGLLCLTSFTEHVFKVHLQYSIYHHFIYLYCQVVLTCMNIPHFIFSSMERYLYCFLYLTFCVYAWSPQSFPPLCDPMNYSPPSSSVHGILQARSGLPWPPLGIFPTQESNLRLLCLLYWQKASLPLAPPIWHFGWQ